MAPGFGLDAVEEKLRDCRLRKMVTKYVGLVHFGLPTSADPHSVLYARVTGAHDLDRMGEDL